MALIPPEVINEIRERTDIVAVIGQHVQLRKAGQSHKGLCPFHNEKTPSFNVNGHKRSFYCFGCQKGGDVFKFVTEYEGRSFVEAVKSLAAQCGVTIPERPESDGERRRRGVRENMYEANRVAKDFFRECLLDPDRGRPGQDYLRERGIGPEIAEKFELGYAPDDWRSLVDHLERVRISANIAEDVGLIVKQPHASGYYARFRHRLMCPVVVPGGQVAGFSGRVLPRTDGAEDDGKTGAKYINTPQTPVYKKSELLFGLHLARSGFRRTGRALLVEGNFDVVSLHQAGFTETIAPLGTALTEQQVSLLRRLSDEVVLLYDGDSAGRAATMKSLELFVAADVRVRVAILPMGTDPDSAVAQGGTEVLSAVLKDALPGIDYFINELWRHRVHSADDHADVLEKAARVVQKVADPVKRDLITGTLASLMGVDPGLVRRAMSRKNNARSNRRMEQHPYGPESVQPQPPQRLERPPPPLEELQLLELINEHPQLFTIVDEQDVVSLLTDERLRDMYFAARHQGADMLSVAPDDIRSLVAKHMLSGSYANVKDPNHSLLEAMARVRNVRRQRELKMLQRQAQEARARGDKGLERQLFHQIVAKQKKVD